jgi:hypothetical protein
MASKYFIYLFIFYFLCSGHLFRKHPSIDSIQNIDPKWNDANSRRGNAEVSDQFVLHRGGIQGCGGCGA